MAGELVELREGALVQERGDALAGRELALGVLLFNGSRGGGVLSGENAFPEIGDLTLRRVDVDLYALTIMPTPVWTPSPCARCVRGGSVGRWIGWRA